jgi:regulator of protease activity HflC (stomatin/prohibitin superfamily)
MLLAGLAFTGCMQVVDDGNVGVKKEWGRYVESPFQAGAHWFLPLGTEWTEVSTRLTSFTIKANAVSKDLQQADTTATVTFSANPISAPLLLRNAGDLQVATEAILIPAAQQGAKAITARYTAEELVTQRERARAEIEDAVRGYVNYVLKSKGISDAIIIQTVAITDFGFSQQFIDTIEAKIKAQQEALRAEVEKRKRITDAEARAAETTLNAEASSKAILLEAEAKAKAIQLEAAAIKDNPGILQLRAIERWSGNAPMMTTGQSPIPFLNLTPPPQPPAQQ